MKCLKLLLTLLIVFTFSFQFLGCGSGSSSDDPTLAQVRDAIISVHGEEDGFTALISALAKGYSIQQITDGAISGRLEVNGDILDGSGSSAISPDNSPVGLVTGKTLQVAVESRFLLIDSNFLDNIGINWDVAHGSIDIPLELAETGHTAGQILNGIDTQLIDLNTNIGFFGIFRDDTQAEFILRAPQRQGAIQLTVNPTIVDSTTTNEDLNSNQSPQFISLSTTSIVGTHRKGQDPCPTDFGNFTITNLSPESVIVDISSTNTAIQIRDSQTFVIGGLLSEEVDVEFNCGSQVPFLSEIPIIASLFQSNQTNNDKQNLIIFVTANIIDPSES